MAPRYKTIAVNLKKFIDEIPLQNVLKDVVTRMHKITMLTSELMVIHILRCLENSLPIPKIDDKWVKMVMMEVTSGNGTRRRTDTELSMSKNSMPAFQAVDRTALDNIMMKAAIMCAACFKTNITTHFRKRIQKFVNWTFNPKDGPRLQKAEYKAYKLQLFKIGNDICKESRDQWESEAKYHQWIETYRHLFKLDVLSPEKPLEDWLEENPEHFLPAMRYINIAFEGSGAKCIALVPLRRTFRPGFYGIDTKGLKQVLHLQSTDYIKERQRRNYNKVRDLKKAQTRSQQQKKDLLMPCNAECE